MWPAARRSATAAPLEIATGRDVEFAAAFALALTGESRRGLAHSRTTSSGAFPSTHQFGSAICRRFAPCSL